MLERASGETYRDYLETKLWDPAGMPLTTFDPAAVMAYGNYSTGHEVDPINGGLARDPETGQVITYSPDAYDTGWLGPAGLAFSTPTEMVTWANLLMDGGGEVLSEASAAAMQAPQMTMDTVPFQSYGYGIFQGLYRGVETLDHGGNIMGWSSQLIWVPEQRYAVSILANTIQSLSGSAYCALREGLALEPQPPVDFSTDPATWGKYAGSYEVLLGGDGRTFPAWVTWTGEGLDVVIDFPADIGGMLRTPLIQAYLDTFGMDWDADGVLDLAVHFIEHPRGGSPSSEIRWMRHRGFVGTRGADSPTPTLVPTEAPPSPTPEASPSPRPTRPPEPIYLPVLLKDPACVPQSQPVDIVFVLDGSAYMHAGHGGRTAWEIARSNIVDMLDLMDFSPDAGGAHDRAGIVVFRHQNQPLPEELVGLSSDRAQLRQFVQALELGDPADRCRIDVGLDYGRRMLLNGRPQRPGNQQVLILLSELQAKRVPFEHIPACEALERGHEECAVLKMAEGIRSQSIQIGLFATGTSNRGGAELPAMVSSPDLFFERPNADQIRSTYQRLAPRTECPPSMFWPRPADPRAGRPERAPTGIDTGPSNRRNARPGRVEAPRPEPGPARTRSKAPPRSRPKAPGRSGRRRRWPGTSASCPPAPA